LCLTLDNMGSAEAIGRGAASGPGPADEGPAGYPDMLNLLDELGLKATFFIEGWNAVHNPEAVCRLVERGHEVGLHGWVHEMFHSLSRAEAERVLTDALTAFARLHINPRGFRAPGGKRGVHTAGLLREFGLVYDSSVDERFIGIDADNEPLALRELANGIISIPWRWQMIDYFQYEMHPEGSRSPEQLEAAFSDALRSAAEEGTLLTLIFHPWVSAQDERRLEAMRCVLKAAKADDRIDIVSAGALANAHLAAKAAGFPRPPV
jgi:peptidoglycan/xylan/chitin deacetylase (PgdA/CDA1 family)